MPALSSFNLVVPQGTQVVSRVERRNAKGQVRCLAGSVGTIVRSPNDGSHTYRIQLPNGTEVSLKRHQFSIRKEYQAKGLEQSHVLSDFDLFDCVIFRCVVGSRAYGLDDENSDTDRRGIYLPPASLHWSLYGVPEQLENHGTEECYWELQKFLILALKANPNVLECLYSPLVEHCSPVAAKLVDMRESFLSRLIYQTYNSYVLSQFKKMEQDLRTRGSIRPKHAMHLIRLLLSGITVLKHVFVPVDVDRYRDRLLDIKYERMPWPEVNQWRLSLHEQFDRAFANTTLAERPDYERANDFLV
ncbi:MAG: nucleotidyltransferase domain-containing protein [Cyanobacteria bacterium P01_G01_bin.4]